MIKMPIAIILKIIETENYYFLYRERGLQMMVSDRN